MLGGLHKVTGFVAFWLAGVLLPGIIAAAIGSALFGRTTADRLPDRTRNLLVPNLKELA
ncbi:MAG: hypothetical protein P3W94_002270 [Paracoccus sp. (in: a-proteobacteria)]|nr:hypothetical protein [Paracoccus sp. (in: a-proteobacteria)]